MKQDLIKLHTAKRLLTIESFISGHYNLNLRELGNKNMKYMNTFHLGLVLVTYKKLFGDQVRPVPYVVYATLLDRERTSALHWMRVASDCVSIYQQEKDEYVRFFNANKDDMIAACSTNESLCKSGYIKIIENIDEQKFAELLERTYIQTLNSIP